MSRAAVRFVERAIRILAIVIVGLITAVQVGWLTRTAILPPVAISPLKGHAFQIRMAEVWSSSWFVSFCYPSDSDSMSDPAISSVQLTEGPHSLGPAHSLHRDIIEEGGGRYSNWNNWLIFSASDNSDPRMNGRAYSVAEAPAASHIAAIPALLMLGLILMRLRMGRLKEMPELAVAHKLMRNIACTRRSAHFVERAIRILAVAIVALIAAGQAGWLTITAILPPTAIGGLKGHAFKVRIAETWSSSWYVSFFYPSDSDSMSDPTISSMQLTEGLHPLGPPHSPHQQIIETGEGRYSHWNDWFVFSASDNSDPRTNRRAYSVAEAPAASRIVAIPALLMLGFILMRLRIGRVSEMLEVAFAQKLLRKIARAWPGGLGRALRQGDSDAVRWSRIRFVERTIRIIAIAIVGLIAAGQAGWLTRTAMLTPAAIAAVEGHAFKIPMASVWSPSWFTSFLYPSDSMSYPAISSLQLTEGQQPLGPPHSLHVDIIEEGGGRFSSWNKRLIFSASDNSDPRTNERVYRVAAAPARSRIAAIPALLMLGLILVRLRMGRVADMPELAIAQNLLRKIPRAWLGILYLASWGVAAAAATYAGTIVYGMWSGDALPTATIYFLWPISHDLHRIGLLLPWGILFVAAIGAALGWVPRPSWREALYKGEHRLIGFWSCAGIPVILLAFLFDMSGGGWSGQYLQTDINYMSNAGLVPYSDAQRYYGSAFEIAYWGHWNGVASLRPFAAALRSLTVFLAGETYPGTLIAQSMLVTIAIMFALRSVVAWRGFWAGLALFALLYGLIRPFLLTTLTEPLGFLWAVFSIGFFAESFRRRSLPFAMIGFAALTCALMTRMGSMFDIPFLMLWLPFAFARQWVLRLKIFAGTVGIVLAAIAINGLLGWTYGAPGSESGGNFSSVLCGLAHGTNWYECYNLKFTGMATAPPISSVNHVFYAEAIRALRADPSVALHALWRNGNAFVYDLPAMLMEQYTRIGYVDRNYLNLGLLLMIPGWCLVVRQSRRCLSLSFALVLFASSVLSSAVIFADDGTRTMIVTYAFFAFFASLGFSSPGSLIQTSPQPLSWRRSSLSLTAALPVLVIIPAVQGVAAGWAAEFNNLGTPADVDVSIIPGRPVLSGFLVVPDGWGHGRDVPSLDLSTLTAMYRAIYTPYYGPSTTDYLPKPPFAIIFAVPRNRKDLRQVFIAPPDLLTNNTAASHWRLQLDLEQSPPHGLPFIVVNKATPIE